MPLKALSKDEDLAAIPGDQPVLVQLPEFADVAAETNGEPEKKVADAADAGSNVLKEQLEALRRANTEADKRAQDAERRAEQAERERNVALSDKASTESDAVTAGLAAAQSEQVSAKQALKIAGESGDWEAVGEAQARIARAASDIREYERAASALADQKQAETRQPVQQPARPTHVNAMIDGNPALIDAERVWLKAHPEAILDPARNKELDVAYIKATRQGLSRGTDAYFKFIETEMGYARNQEDNGSMTVSAPVHRNERDNEGRPSGGKIMLSPEQREIAKSMGISDIEYARQVAAFDVARKADPEKYR